MALRCLRFFVLFLVVALPIRSWAESPPENKVIEVKASLATESPANPLRIEPLRLSGGSELTVVSPSEWELTARKLSDSLSVMHGYFTQLFGSIPAFSTKVRLMPQDQFFAETGAPSWTNALYYRGQIMLPISAKNGPDVADLIRSLRHEYTHAVINALSSGKCPGWLDEGMAQWAEGSENPALRPALANWLSNRRPVSLDLLQGGFTKLDPTMVPAAYAQSLYAANAVMNNYGFRRIRIFLDGLRGGQSKEEAFSAAFTVGEGDFEQRLDTVLVNWARKHSQQ